MDHFAGGGDIILPATVPIRQCGGDWSGIPLKLWLVGFAGDPVGKKLQHVSCFLLLIIRPPSTPQPSLPPPPALSCPEFRSQPQHFLPVDFDLHAYAQSLQSCPTLRNLMDCSQPDSSVHGDFSGKNTGVGCHFLYQEMFPTQGSNLHLLCLLRCRWILYCWATGGSALTIKDWKVQWRASWLGTWVWKEDGKPSVRKRVWRLMQGPACYAQTPFTGVWPWEGQC